MSHFCLGVICRNGTESDIAKLLAPFSVKGDENCGIVKMKWLLEEYKEPILNNEEKEILNQLVVANSVISNKKLVFVQKVSISNYSNKSCLILMFEDSNGVYTARFNTDCIFKRMEEGKRYILEELGLC